MFFIFGFGHRTIKKSGTAPAGVCQRCNNSVERDMLKVTTWFTLFFIPIIPYRTEYMHVCPICGDAVPSDRAAFDGAAGGGHMNFESGGQAHTEQNVYAGKTPTQINFLKEMEAARKAKEEGGNIN